MPTIRTTTHSYPQGEVDPMIEFYRGKRCVVSLDPDVVQWSHMLDAALSSTTPQLRWMLQRNLRQDRYPAHAAEVRENIVPLTHQEHACIDFRPARATLFLHEDLVAKTLQFERELKDWRLAEIKAGRGDPGRPGYGYVFMTSQGTSPPTPHRWHASLHYRGVGRNTPDDTDVTWFRKEQCPGIDPPHLDPFPVIDTLLSIPFSLLYNLPRLQGLINGSAYRFDLINMATEVTTLWVWDPDISVKTPVILNSLRDPVPRPIHDASRNETFAAMRPSAAASIPAGPSAPDSVVQADSGAYIIGTSPHVRLHDGALTIVPLDLNVRIEKEKICHTTTHVAATSLLGSTSQLSGSMESTHSDTIDSNDESEAKVDLVSLRASVRAWLEDIEEDPLPVDVSDTDPFIPGVISGMSVNDILMVKGHIDPSVLTRLCNVEFDYLDAQIISNQPSITPYAPEAHSFLRSIYTKLLKNNEYLRGALLAGILPIDKASLLNNA